MKSMLRFFLKLVVTVHFAMPFAMAQQPSGVFGIPTTPLNAEGAPIKGVLIQLHRGQETLLADSLETDAFYRAFQLKAGTAFRQVNADLALKTIERQPEIRSASYEVYNTEFGGPVLLLVHVYFLEKGENKVFEGKKGMLYSGKLRDFPLFAESDRAKFTFILNGAAGVYNDVNAFFAQGPAFTQGNPIATDPAGEETRFWGEMNLEPGFGFMTRLGKSSLYPYGAASYMLTARNTTDIYSSGPTAFGAIERLYGGILVPRLGKNKDISIDVSAGRQFFQLNDGFLISRFSGSANAGERGSVYLNSRTTFEMTGIAKLQFNKFSVDGFYVEPQELFKETQTNTRYLGGQVGYNDNKTFDVGLSYISIVNSTAKYRTPLGTIDKKGMRILNPRVYLNDLAGTGIFVKTEYAYQTHSDADMVSNAWYAGLGIRKNEWLLRPSLYYRYAFMQGDNPASETYGRFDAILTGGLANWIQGINFRKVLGNGNLISHRIEMKAYLSKTFEISFDYFWLKSDQLNNQGGLAPIAQLTSTDMGTEATFSCRYFLNNHFLLLGVFSFAQPGEGIENAFEGNARTWSSYQASLFMFF